MPSVHGIHRLTLAPAPERERWIGELRAIKTAGFNSIRLPVEWRTTEPERGQYRFDRIGDLLTTAAETGLRVIVQVDAHSGPAWVRRRYPDSAVVRGGEPEREPRPDTAWITRAFAPILVRSSVPSPPPRRAHPAFYAIDVGATPACLPRQPTEFCYCPHTEARFRDALQRRYGTLPALNAAWRRSLTAWSGVHVPRSGAAAVELSDWRQFVVVKLQEDLKFRSDASAPEAPGRSRATAIRPRRPIRG